MFPSRETLIQALENTRRFLHKTPVMTSRLIDADAGAQIYFKCENFQRMGAFKMRGASNAILKLSEAQREKGVVTHSSGNFAQALALSAQLIECAAHIVMPQNAPQVKKDAVRGYGGRIIESESTPIAREETADRVQSETGAEFIHPSDDLNVIIGNSTAAQELFAEVQNLDYLLAPVGGGGLIAGTALAAHRLSPGTVVIGAEPTGADDAYRSKRDGIIYPSENPDTICDGLRTNLGHWNFPIIESLVEDILLVSDSDTLAALQLIYERMKIIVEPSSAIVLAAVRKNKARFAGKRVGLIISGGNVDLQLIAAKLNKKD